MEFVVKNLWLMIAVTGFLTVGIAVLLVTTGYLNRIMDWLRPDSSKNIPVKVFCEDGQIRDRKLAVGRYCVSDHKLRRSFYLVHKLQLVGSAGKAKFLALTERNARPIDFHNRMTPDDWAIFPDAQTVFIDTTADIRSESAKEATTNFMAQSLAVIALAVAVIVVIMGIIIFFQSKGAGI